MRWEAQEPRDAANAAEEGQRHAVRSSQRRKGVNAVTEVLLLNASFEPLRLVSVKKAIVLLLQEKAEVVEAAEARLRAQHAAFDVPLVSRLVRYVSVGQRSPPVPCSRRGVFIRDRETCQYCGAQPGRKRLTIDHILPRSKGGTTAWENVVAACEACNHRKGGRTPTEAGMTLRTAPAAPRYVAFALVGELERHTVWRKYAT
jgi:5-methylcytosine-specific restriction endonuclease McrA